MASSTEKQIKLYAKRYAEALNKTFRNQSAFWTDDVIRIAIRDGIDPLVALESYQKLIEDVDELVIPVALESAEDGAEETADEFGKIENPVGGPATISTGAFAVTAATALVLNISTQATNSLQMVLPFVDGRKNAAKIVRASIGLNGPQTSGIIRRFRKLAGVSGDKVAAREALRQIKEHRVRRLGTYSTNDIVTAYTEGKDQHFKGLPGIKFKTWVTKVDELRCPICASLHLQEVPIYEMFLSSKGYIDRPTAHPNCRCQLRYRILK